MTKIILDCTTATMRTTWTTTTTSLIVVWNDITVSRYLVGDPADSPGNCITITGISVAHFLPHNLSHYRAQTQHSLAGVDRLVAISFLYTFTDNG